MGRAGGVVLQKICMPLGGWWHATIWGVRPPARLPANPPLRVCPLILLLPGLLCTHPFPACRATLTAVCKRWHALFFSSAPIWRQLDLTMPARVQQGQPADLDAWFAAKLAQLQRCRALVQHLEVQQAGDIQAAARHSPSGWHLRELLDSLQPGVLRSVKLQRHPEPQVGAVLPGTWLRTHAHGRGPRT